VVSLSRAPGTPWSSHTSSDGELTFLQKVPPPRPGRAAEMIHITGYAATSSPRRSTRGYNPPPRWAAGAKADGQRVVPAPAGPLGRRPRDNASAQPRRAGGAAPGRRPMDNASSLPRKAGGAVPGRWPMDNASSLPRKAGGAVLGRRPMDNASSLSRRAGGAAPGRRPMDTRHPCPGGAAGCSHGWSGGSPPGDPQRNPW
jgi:hypothetical protein